MYSMVPPREELNTAHDPYISKILLIEIDPDFKCHNILSETYLTDSHLDGCHFIRNQLYLTSQMKDLVHVFKLKGHQFHHFYDIKGFNLPRGVDVDKEKELIAVANFGDHSIYLAKL